MEEQEGRREEYSEEDVQLLFRAVGKMHKACLRKEMDRRGLAEVGQPFILFMLERDADGEYDAQRKISERLGVSPATVTASLKSLEKSVIIDALRRHGGIQHKAARELGITPRQMGYRVKKFGLEKLLVEHKGREPGVSLE